MALSPLCDDLLSLPIQQTEDTQAEFDHEVASLFLACKGGDIEVVQQWLEKGGYVDVKGGYENCFQGYTPLVFACYYAQIPIIQLLLQHNANINYKIPAFVTSAQFKPPRKGRKLSSSLGNSTIIEICATRGHVEVVRLLVERGATLDHESSKEKTAFHFAAQYGHLEVAKVLVEGGCKVNSAVSGEWTALHYAAEEGHIDMIEYLLQQDSSLLNFGIIDSNSVNMTPVCIAACNGQTEAVKTLIKHGAILYDKELSISALLFATTEGHLETVKLLVENGSNVNEIGTLGWLPLHNAALKNQLAIVEYILQRDTSAINQQISEKVAWTPLFLAAAEGHLEVVKLLIKYGAEVNVSNENGQNPLHHAALNGHLEVVKILVEHKCVVYPVDEKGRTPLYFAVKRGHTEVVAYLLSIEAKFLDKQSRDDGNTILCDAAKEGHLEIIKLLIKYGADVNKLSRKEGSAFTVASTYGHVEIVKFLLENGSGLDAVDSMGWNALHGAAWFGYPEIVHIIVAHDPKMVHVKIPSTEWTALYFAAVEGNLDIVKLLLNNGAEMNVAGLAPLFSIACLGGHLPIVKFLLENGADIHLPCPVENSPLFLAMQRDRKDVVKLLINLGAQAPPPLQRATDQAEDSEPTKQKNLLATFLSAERKQYYSVGSKEEDISSEIMARRLCLMGARARDLDAKYIERIIAADDTNLMELYLEFGLDDKHLKEMNAKSTEMKQLLNKPRNPMSLQNICLQSIGTDFGKYSENDLEYLFERFIFN